MLFVTTFYSTYIVKISWTNHINNEAVLHRVKEKRNILHTIRRRKANWIGHNCAGTAFYNTSLKERLEGQESEEGDVSSCWMTLRKQEDTGS
jgi:hypothetical protein